LLVTGQYAEAEAAFREAVQLDRGEPEVHNNLGVLLHRTGQYEEAEAAFREAIRLDPGSAAARTNLASVAQARKRGSWRKYLPTARRPHR
jgi:Flp pilus assembly protein TadD